jgi:hypothetical protein
MAPMDQYGNKWTALTDKIMVALAAYGFEPSQSYVESTTERDGTEDADSRRRDEYCRVKSGCPLSNRDGRTLLWYGECLDGIIILSASS